MAEYFVSVLLLFCCCLSTVKAPLMFDVEDWKAKVCPRTQEDHQLSMRNTDGAQSYLADLEGIETWIPSEDHLTDIEDVLSVTSDSAAAIHISTKMLLSITKAVDTLTNWPPQITENYSSKIMNLFEKTVEKFIQGESLVGATIVAQNLAFKGWKPRSDELRLLGTGFNLSKLLPVVFQRRYIGGSIHETMKRNVFMDSGGNPCSLYPQTSRTPPHGQYLVMESSKLAYNPASHQTALHPASFSSPDRSGATSDISSGTYNAVPLTTDFLRLSAASVQLPAEVFENVTEEHIGMYCTIYLKTSLFPVAPDSRKEGFSVGSPVVGAAVSGKNVTDLDSPVVITLPITAVENYTRFLSTVCVAWDFTAGNWSEAGCKTVKIDDESGLVVCQCNHLTNFAVLVDTRARTGGEVTQDVGLEVLTYMSTILSIIGLIFTSIDHVVFRDFNRSVLSFRFQSGIALLCLLLVALVGIERNENEIICTAMSVLIQYFTLAAVFLMAAQAVLLYLMLVHVLSRVAVIASTKKWNVIVSLICWLSPLVAVIPTLATLATGQNMLVFVLNKTNQTSGEERTIGTCFISDPRVFFTSYFAPLFAVVIFNTVVSIRIVCSMIRHQSKRSTKYISRITRIVMSIIVWLGPMWLFGALTVGEASTAFQYLFTIFSGLQGFFIFIVSLFNKKHREYWVNRIIPCKEASKCTCWCQCLPPWVNRIITCKEANRMKREKELLHACAAGCLQDVKDLLSQRHADCECTDETGNTPLHVACENDHIHIVEFLVFEKRCSINPKRGDGCTPLHVACQRGQTAIVDLLTSTSTELYSNIEELFGASHEPCNVNIQDRNGNTPLHIACIQGNAQLFKILMSTARCKPNVKNEDGDTPLHVACAHNHQHILELATGYRACKFNIQNGNGNSLLHIAISNELDDVFNMLLVAPTVHLDLNLRNNIGDTVLHIAVKRDSIELCQKIVAKEIDPNIQNNNGETPLHIAASSENGNVAKVLLDLRQCNVNLQDNFGQTPTHIAAKQQNPVLHMLLREKSCNPFLQSASGSTVLQIASGQNDISTIQTLLSHRHATYKQLNLQNDCGDTALHIATRNDNTTVAEILLSKGCASDVQNVAGRTPLHIAAISLNSETIHLLTDSGCNPNIQDNQGNTPLHILTYKADVDLFSFMLTCERCDPNVKDNQGNTPMHIATANGNPDLCNLILSHQKCDLNSQNEDGDTPLHIAAHNDCNIAMTILNDTRCNPNLSNKDANTVLHIATEKEVATLFNSVLAHSMCNRNIQNKLGRTPLHIAVDLGSIDAIQSLLSSSQCDVNLQNENGDTPLHVAARNKSLEICSLIVGSEQCDLNITNDQGNTPLHIATEQSCYEISQYLAANKSCDLNIQNTSGNTPLHVAILKCNPSIAHCLLKQCDPTITNREGNSPLHLACIIANKDPSILPFARLLVSEGFVDPSCINNRGQTAVELTVDYQLIQEMIHFIQCRKKHSVEKYIKIFCVGNPEVGKSTLVEVISTEAGKWWKLIPRPLRRVKNVPHHTAGIIPTLFQSRLFGNIVLYDMAGQIEYYSSHAAVIERTLLCSPPAFIVVVNLAESVDDIIQKLKFWWSFIDNHAARAQVALTAPPHVILVGSHADVVKSRGENRQRKLESVATAARSLPCSFTFVGEIVLDCRPVISKPLNDLRSLINQSCAELRKVADVDLRCHVLYAFLLEKFHGQVACTVSDIASFIQESDVLLPSHPADLLALVSTLSDRGLVLLVQGNSCNEDESWVVLQDQVLLEEINGTMFAPETFKEHRAFSRSTGVVPFSKIKREFTKYNPYIIVGFLTHFEFCFELDDLQILQQIQDEILPFSEQSGITNQQQICETNSQSQEVYYFFPALVKTDNPPEIWNQGDVESYQSGWFFHSIHPDQFLSTRFLHVLILRIAFYFALASDPDDLNPEVPVICRRCSVWKHGITWKNRYGIESVVEVGLQKQWVSVMMRCPQGTELKCVQLRSEVTKSIRKAMDEFCPVVEMSESFIHPSNVKFPFSVTSDMKVYTIREVATTLATGEPCVMDKLGQCPLPVEQLLFFEPYFGFGRELIQELFEQHPEERVPEAFLAQLAKRVHHRRKLYEQMICPDPSIHEEIRAETDSFRQCFKIFQALHWRIKPTYKNFHEQLDEFSIFCGRNPMALTPAK